MTKRLSPAQPVPARDPEGRACSACRHYRTAKKERWHEWVPVGWQFRCHHPDLPARMRENAPPRPHTADACRKIEPVGDRT